MSKISHSNIDLVPISEALKLQRVPAVIHTYDVATYFHETNSVGVNLNLFATKETFLQARNSRALVNALQWNLRRPMTSLVRWVIAHELGHAVQAQRYGIAEFLTRYSEQVAALRFEAMFVRDDVYLQEIEKRYRATEFEAEADEYANKYWQHVKIVLD